MAAARTRVSLKPIQTAIRQARMKLQRRARRAPRAERTWLNLKIKRLRALELTIPPFCGRGAGFSIGPFPLKRGR